MFVKVAFAALLALVSVPATPQAAVPPNPIPKVVCPKLNGAIMGTAFRVGKHLLITAKHVADEAPCSIEGLAMHVAYTSPNSDFAMLSDDRTGPFLKVDCGGFVTGREYIALGHARGSDAVIAVPLIATGAKHKSGMSVLVGILTTIPGQSGGPIIDSETGAAVGIVNASSFEAGFSVSVQLKDTPICGARS